MIIVGHVYNNNGMASWCIETAWALHQAGYEVMLVHDPLIDFSDKHFPFQTLSFAMPSSVRKAKGLWGKCHTFLNFFSGKSNGYSYYLHQYLTEQKIGPALFIINQSDFLDGRVTVKQYLCAWVYPLKRNNYLRSGVSAAMNSTINKKILSVLISLSFYYKDKAAYQRASKVFALSPLMLEDMQKNKVNAVLVSPCCGVEKSKIDIRKDGQINLVMAALDLDSPRKNISWILQALNTLPKGNFCITLIGEAGAGIKKLTQSSPHRINITGVRPRKETLELFKTADIFLFASIVDDWGYVIVEAMAAGAAVLVPDKNPYNYIAGNEDCIYRAGESADFLSKLNALMTNPKLDSIKNENYLRATSLFSREAFAKQVMPLIG